MTRLSYAAIKQSAELQDLKAELLDQVSRLPINLVKVKEKATAIEKVNCHTLVMRGDSYRQRSRRKEGTGEPAVSPTPTAP